MLKRVLEPEVMDSFEDAMDYDSMDHSQVNRQFVEDLLAVADFPNWESIGTIDTEDLKELEVLDLGTGTAQIPIELCRRCESVWVLAVDLAGSMLEVARTNIELAEVYNRILLDLVDAKNLPLEEDRFSCVISNSLVHHLSDPQPVLSEALRVLAPGGLIFVRDLARPVNDDQVAKLVAQYAGDCNERQQELFEDSLRAAFTVDEMQDMIAAYGCPPEAVGMTSDRHWTWSYRKPA